MKLRDCRFCMLPEKNEPKEAPDREILFQNATVYVVAPFGYRPEEALLIIPKHHYEDLATATVEDSSIAYDVALAEKWVIERYFDTEGYWGVEHCGDVKGNSGRSQRHAHKWCTNCLPNQNTTGMGTGTLRRLINELPPAEFAVALERLRERGN